MHRFMNDVVVALWTLASTALVARLRDDMPRLEKSWKLVLHGLKSNLDIFSCWKKAQEEAKQLEEEMGEIASYAEKRVADLEPGQILYHLVLLVPRKRVS